MKWKRYGVSLLNAFISGMVGGVGSGGSAVILGVSANTSLKIALLTAAGSGITSAAKWLQQHPLPGAEQ